MWKWFVLWCIVWSWTQPKPHPRNMFDFFPGENIMLCFIVMHLSVVCPTSPTWGRWGNGGGFVLWISYFAPYMGHNYRVLPPSTPLSPILDCSNVYCGASKRPNKHRFSTFLVSAQFGQTPHLARPMGSGFNDMSPMFAPSMPQVG